MSWVTPSPRIITTRAPLAMVIMLISDNPAIQKNPLANLRQNASASGMEKSLLPSLTVATCSDVRILIGKSHRWWWLRNRFTHAHRPAAARLDGSHGRSIPSTQYDRGLVEVST